MASMDVGAPALVLAFDRSLGGTALVAAHVAPIAAMKVLLQHPTAAGAISGVLTYCTLLRAALAEAGVEAEIISTQRARSAELWRAVRKADVVHLNSNHLRLLAFARFQRKPILIKYHYPFWDEVTFRPHVPMGWLRRFGRDVGFVWRETAGNAAGARVKHVVLRAGRACLRLVVAATVDARLACSEFVARSADLPWPVGVDYNPAVFPATPLEFEAERGPSTLVFAGRLDTPKGVDVLLEAAARLRARGLTFSVEIAGEGTESAALRARAARSDLAGTVRFLGQVSRETTLATMRRARAVVVPSRSNDSAPYVIVEAAALGRCAVGSRCGGIPELIGDAGLLFASEDVEELAGHLETLLVDRSEARTRGRAAFEYLRLRCAAPVATARLLAVYRRLLEDRRAVN